MNITLENIALVIFLCPALVILEVIFAVVCVFGLMWLYDRFEYLSRWFKQ